MAHPRVLQVQKRALIRDAGVYVDFPYQKNIHQLPREEFLSRLVDLYFKDETYGDREPSNFEEMLYARFGRGIAERFLVPYNEKLYATKLSNLDVDAMGRFFPHADVDDIIRNFTTPANESYNTHFTYPEGGAIQYVEAIAQGVESSKILLNEPVIALDVESRTARTPNREISYDRVISSMPFDRLLRLTGLEHDPEIFTYNKVLVFNLGFDRKGPDGVNWIYYPSRDLCFYRVGFYDNIFGADRMSLYVEIGYPADAEIDDEHVATMRARVLQDLEAAGVVEDHRLVSSHSVILDPAYVHIHRASVEAVDHFKGVLEDHGIYSAGRYGSWTYCSIEDNMVEARALAERIGG